MKLPTLAYEKKLWSRGVKKVVGIDEVGRGSWAGPVVAAAVIFSRALPKTFNDVSDLKKIRDSKLLTPKQRDTLSEVIKKHCAYYSVSEISLKRINRWGIGKCSQYAFRKAIKELPIKPEHILIDAFYVKYIGKKKQTPIIKGDQKCFSIAAASIIAKVHRDNLMKKLHKKYPKYRFDKHKGYGTKLHQEKINKYGLSEVHRKSFKIGKT